MYKLTSEQEIKFEKIYSDYQNKISLALYKCNINYKNYDYFYSYALEGLLQAFLILEAGDITKEDFSAFAFTSMKRKIIDELRRQSRNKEIPLDIEETCSKIVYNEDKIEEFIYSDSLETMLTDKEERIYNLLKKGYTYKEIIEIEKVSKSSYYNILGNLIFKSQVILYK